MNSKELSELIVQLRKKCGYSRKEVARLTGVPYSTICNYEYGTRDVPYEFLYKVSDIYGIKVEEVLGISKEDKKETSPDQISEEAVYQHWCGWRESNSRLILGKDT